MDDLSKALGDISSIRRQVARSTEFRGYGPATLAATAAFALLASGVQKFYVSDPAREIRTYLLIWISTAVVSGTLIAVQMYTRSQRMHSGMADEMIRMAAEQFLPSGIAGVLLTIVIVQYVPSVTWMLPGLWQIVCSLGVFASCRFMPRLMVAAGVWYLISGLCCIRIGDAHALAPWTMGLAFGLGQSLVAAILIATRQEAGDES